MKEEKPYWQQLKDEYSKLPKEASDEVILKWYEQYEIQRKQLLEDFGEISWVLNDFSNLLRSETISESHFRELCRYELDKRFKK